MQTPGFELKINSVTAAELNHMVTSLAQQFGVTLPTTQEVAQEERNVGASPALGEPYGEAQKTTEQSTDAGKEEKTKRTRRTKAEIEAEKTAETKIEESSKEEAKTEAKTEDGKITWQHIADKCQEVTKEKNLQTAKDVLAKFINAEDGQPVRKIKQLSESDFAKFIAECDKAIKA